MKFLMTCFIFLYSICALSGPETITLRFRDCKTIVKGFLDKNIIVKISDEDLDRNFKKKWGEINRSPWPGPFRALQRFGQARSRFYRWLNENGEYWGMYLYDPELPLLKFEWYTRYYDIPMDRVPDDVKEEVEISRAYVKKLKNEFFAYKKDLESLFRIEEYLEGLEEHLYSFQRQQESEFESFNFITNEFDQMGRIGDLNRTNSIDSRKELKVLRKKEYIEKLNEIKKSKIYERLLKDYGKQFQLAIDHAKRFELLNYLDWELNDLRAAQFAESTDKLSIESYTKLRREQEELEGIVTGTSQLGRDLKPSPIAQYHLEMLKRLYERSLLFKKLSDSDFLQKAKEDGIFKKIASTKKYWTNLNRNGKYRKLLQVLRFGPMVGGTVPFIGVFSFLFYEDPELEKMKMACLNLPVPEDYKINGDPDFYVCSRDYVRRNSAIGIMLANLMYRGDVEKINTFLEKSWGPYETAIEDFTSQRVNIIQLELSKKRDELNSQSKSGHNYDWTKYEVLNENITDLIQSN